MKILFLLLGLLFVSCNELESGYVTKKYYEPESIIVTTLPMMIPDGNGGFTTILVPYVIVDGEDWCIDIKGVKGKDTLNETYYVNKAQYDSLNIGSFLCVKGLCNEDINNTQTEQ